MIDDLTRGEQERLLGRRIEDLLDEDDRGRFEGQTCLITGAGGSVGAELARQVATCRPGRLVLVEHSEVALFRIDQQLALDSPATPLEPVLCDVTRAASVARLMRRVRPDVVFHAAAYKHVTMAERHAAAAARVNVLGTVSVLTAARDAGARFVFISSDKAAAPTSVMGATKRLAELAVLSDPDPRTRPVVVRFGNVLASSASFVEIMRHRLRERRPLILTDPDATRFFMAVSEAASLVMKATILARGGETFWLDMGPQVRIGDLADRLIAVAESQGLAGVPVHVIGLRPGEKRHEQLESQGIGLERTVDPRIWVARQPTAAPARCAASITALRRAVVRDDAHGVLHVLAAALPDFAPSDFAWEIARTMATAARPSPAARRSDPARPGLSPRVPTGFVARP
jgi:FlaA1/EpsC-like NDP-sugar epimerase